MIESPKMSVFEKQLSLINSSSVGMKSTFVKRKQPSMGYFKYSSSPISSNSIGTGDSTLIGSISSSNLKSGNKYYTNNNNKSHMIKRRSSIHLRISFYYFTEFYKFIITNYKFLNNYFKSIKKEQIKLIFELISIFTISLISTFSSDVLKLNKEVFISSLPFSSILIFNQNLNMFFSTSYILKLKENSLELTKRLIFKLTFAFQSLLLFSLIRIAVIFKNKFLTNINAENLNFDQLTLLSLVLSITSILANIVLNSIPDYFRLINEDDEYEDEICTELNEN